MFVGRVKDAMDWAYTNVDAIVNCAQYNFNYNLKDRQQHRWLHIQERSWFNGRSWFQRMRSILAFVITHLAAGRAVLLHCHAGKHRSGCFGVLVIALIQGRGLDEAAKSYFRERPLPGEWDQKKVHSIAERHRLREFLEELVTEGFCEQMLTDLRREDRDLVSRCSGGAGDRHRGDRGHGTAREPLVLRPKPPSFPPPSAKKMPLPPSSPPGSTPKPPPGSTPAKKMPLRAKKMPLPAKKMPLPAKKMSLPPSSPPGSSSGGPAASSGVLATTTGKTLRPRTPEEVLNDAIAEQFNIAGGAKSSSSSSLASPPPPRPSGSSSSSSASPPPPLPSGSSSWSSGVPASPPSRRSRSRSPRGRSRSRPPPLGDDKSVAMPWL